MPKRVRLPFPPEDVSRLAPGDLLLYDSPGLIPFLIKSRTWSRYSHVEVYMGEGIAYASRAHTGVRSYPLRLSGLAAVFRPTEPFDAHLATLWHNTCAVGRPYDWKGLFRYFRRGRQSEDAYFCSEYALPLLRAGGAALFAGSYPYDLVPPGHILSSPHGLVVWNDEGGWYDESRMVEDRPHGVGDRPIDQDAGARRAD
jgi:hypothetical protein